MALLQSIEDKEFATAVKRLSHELPALIDEQKRTNELLEKLLEKK